MLILGFFPNTRTHLHKCVQRAEADTSPLYKLAFTSITLQKHTRLSSAASASGLNTLNPRHLCVLRLAFVFALFPGRRLPDLEGPWLRNEIVILVWSISTSRGVRFRPFHKSGVSKHPIFPSDLSCLRRIGNRQSPRHDSTTAVLQNTLSAIAPAMNRFLYFSERSNTLYRCRPLIFNLCPTSSVFPFILRAHRPRNIDCGPTIPKRGAHLPRNDLVFVFLL